MKSTPEIMVTIGPTLEKPEDLCRAVEAGARWFRLPCGYRQRPHVENARSIREAAAQRGVSVQLLLDLPSSRPRTGSMEDLRLEIGARVNFWDSNRAEASVQEPGAKSVPLPRLHDLLGKIEPGHRLWFCDGRLEFRADKIGDDCILAHLERGTIPLKSSNSIYLPDSASPFAMMTEEDHVLLADFVEAGLVPDWIALSLVSTVEDVRAGRAEIPAALAGKVRIMAKIETAPAVQQADAILREADGIMVARGDLGPAMDFIRLPEAQEQLVKAAKRAGKPVVVATQILEYFADAGVPLRSELSGLSLLAIQNPDAIMLGKETVYSPRPIESIRFAREVLEYETRRLESCNGCVPRSLAASLGPPYVVAIEGPNGAGKTLLCSLLSQRLGLPALRGVPTGWEDSPQKLRMIRDADWLASAMYFLSGTIEASREAAGVQGDVKVMDRSLWSTLAVHYAHDPARLDQLLPLVDLAAGRVKVPDLVIVLEASPAACRQRIARKSAHDQQFDAASPATDVFGRREREFYHWLAGQWPKVAFIDTENSDADAVFRQAADLIRDQFPCCNR